MKTKRPVQMLLVTLITGVLGISVAQADGTAPVWQYEMGFGGKQSTGTFYLSYRASDGGYSALSDWGSASSFRIPLYSTDPRVPSFASQFSLLMNAADDDSDSDGDGNSFKKAIGGLIGAVVVLGPPIVGMVKTIKELECIPYCDAYRK